MSPTTPNRTTVPFLDLGTHHRALSEQIVSAWHRVLSSASFVGGEEVESFEREFASYVGTSHSVGVSSGTDALRLALLALDLRPGDEVVTVPHTFAATAEAILQAGGRPVFVDVDPDSATMDPSLVEAAITARTRILLPVHLYGQPADMAPIREIARRHGLRVLEDACQAHGAEYAGRRAGCLGDAAAFSFYPGKNLGACGEAGVVTTDDRQVAERVRQLRDHGQSRKYHHDVVGYNARLDALQAAVLRVKLPHLETWNDARKRRAEGYRERLGGSDACLPEVMPGRTHVFHLYVIRLAGRDRIRTRLADAGIATGLHYPVPLHLQKAYTGLERGPGSFPRSETWARDGLSLPMFPELTDEQVDRVCEELLAAIARP